MGFSVKTAKNEKLSYPQIKIKKQKIIKEK